MLLGGAGVVPGGKDSRFAVGFSIPLVAMVLAVLVVSRPAPIPHSLTHQASLYPTPVSPASIRAHHHRSPTACLCVCLLPPAPLCRASQFVAGTPR